MKGRKRHIVPDTLRSMVDAVVHSADVQDEGGAPLVLRSILKSWPWLGQVFAPSRQMRLACRATDGCYAMPKLRATLSGNGDRQIEITKRSDAAHAFVALPRLRVAVRTLAWPGLNDAAASPKTGKPPSRAPKRGL